MSLTHRQIYVELIEFAKSFGIKVLHRRLNDYGVYYPGQRILIERRIIYTKLGLLVLAHEIGHLLDHADGKFQDFFNGSLSECNGYTLYRIKEMEQSACVRGKQLLKGYGIKAEYGELTKPESYYRLWKKSYFS